MQKIRLSLFVICSIIILFTLNIHSGGAGETETYREVLEQLRAKDEITIIITDSGLGGMSVLAQIEEKLRLHHPFRKVRLVFFNALPSESYLYNQMASTGEKLRVFNSALKAMAVKYQPDIIFIACNTLSVIYPETEFARKGTVPVIGIVEFGVDLIYDNLEKDEDSRIVILGTPTTISQNTHRAKLIENEIAENRIIVQPCEMLESEIQADPASDVVETMIDMYAYEALENETFEGNEMLFVSLCCTHYGYAENLFESVFSNVSGGWRFRF